MPARKIDWTELTAKEIMQPEVVTVATSTPLSEVERILSDHRIGGVPVTNEAGHIVGVLSLRDLIDRYTQDPDARPRRGHGFYQMSNEELLEEDLESFEVPDEAEETAGELMTAQIFSVKPDAKLPGIAKEMVAHNIHRLLVQDGTRTLGLISTMDILRAIAAV